MQSITKLLSIGSTRCLLKQSKLFLLSILNAFFYYANNMSLFRYISNPLCYTCYSGPGDYITGSDKCGRFGFFCAFLYVSLNTKETGRAPSKALIDCLDKAFQKGCNAPIRHHHHVSIPNEKAATLLIMPAWQEGEFLGIKHVFVVPESHRRARPSH